MARAIPPAGVAVKTPGRIRRFLPLLAAGVLVVATLLQPGAATAQNGERIRDFESRIKVHADGSMTVQESITVVSAGRHIRRGIYRDFPTTYKDRHGHTVSVGFALHEVRRNGRKEPYHIERRSNGLRIYIGESNFLIPDGEHRYTLVYRTNRQIGYYDDFDELYWNVTGNGWAFPIERASAYVALPPNAEIFEWDGYTGRPGEQGQDFSEGNTVSGSAIELQTERVLEPGEGFTIAIAWPKGFVIEPSLADKFIYLLDDNPGITASIAGFVFVLIYFLAAWSKVGRDPEKGAIIPEYDPPSGISPPAARYLMHMGFDNKVFTSAVMSLAVKGCLRIREDEGKAFTLEKRAESNRLSPGEKAVLRSLFSAGRREVALTQSNHKILQEAQKALRESLRTDFEKSYFLRNRKVFIPGLIATGIVALATAILGRQPEVALFMVVWLSGWSFGCYFLLCRVITRWRAVFAGGGAAALFSAVVITAFAAPFFFGEVFALAELAEVSSVAGALVLLALIFLNLLFYHLLKAPTRLGRRVMDRIEGFLSYLSVAEKDRMNLLNPPERTPDLFEKFLPFALALGVEQAWSEQFAGVLDAAGRGDGAEGYRPGWYSGHGFHHGGITGFTSGLSGSFSNAIAASSTAPGSSSGSSGGGSSGGGGGGGGGGGW